MKYHTHVDRGDKVMFSLNCVFFSSFTFINDYNINIHIQVIIFADDVVALELICTSLGVPFIIGRTQEDERRGERSSPVHTQNMTEIAKNLPLSCHVFCSALYLLSVAHC